MANGQCKYVPGIQDGAKFRCRIKRIVCIISKKGKCFIYEYRPNAKKKMVEFICDTSLSKYMTQIKDPHFFPIFRGRVFNTRFYESHNSFRNLFANVDGVPELRIARDCVAKFEEYLQYW